MKTKTSILETLSYFFKWFSVYFVCCEIFLVGPFYAVFILGIILWALGYFLSKWEYRLESKRLHPVKHYDYKVLKGFGYFCFVAALYAFAKAGISVPINVEMNFEAFGFLISGIYLLQAGRKRKAMYNRDRATPSTWVERFFE